MTYRRFLRRLALPVAIAVLPAAPIVKVSAETPAKAAGSRLTKAEAREGWLLLFDGKTLFGWEPHGEATWHVNDGALVGVGEKQGWLGTTTEFANFELRCRYRINQRGNSGIFLRAKKDDALPREGYEMQICDDHPQSKTGSIRGKIRATYPDGSPPTRTGGWQDVRIRAEGEQLQVWLNGVQVVNGCDKAFARGVIGLEVYSPGTEVAFRDIKLKPLGLESIFNGKDLTGWEIFKAPGLKSEFFVEPEGVLNIRSGHGQISTVDSWKDFVIQVEIFTHRHGLNSGVFFRCRPHRRLWGYEAQIRNLWEGDDRSKPRNYGTGGIYNRQHARYVYSSDREWFTMTVVAHGNHFATWVDGHQAADWTDKRPRHENPRKGYRPEAGLVALQGHDKGPDALVSFRNIRITEYPPAPEQ